VQQEAGLFLFQRSLRLEKETAGSNLLTAVLFILCGVNKWTVFLKLLLGGGFEL
jgi:hypothetical protein